MHVGHLLPIMKDCLQKKSLQKNFVLNKAQFVAMWFMCDIKKKITDMIITHDSKLQMTSPHVIQKLMLVIQCNNVITRINNIKEARNNEFSSINTAIEALQNGLIQCYAITRRVHPLNLKDPINRV